MKLLIKSILGVFLLSTVSCSNTDTQESENISKKVASDANIIKEEALEEVELAKETTEIEVDLFELEPSKSIPVYDDYQIIEKTTTVYIEEFMDEPEDQTYSVLLTGEMIDELTFDSIALAEIDLNALEVENDSLLNVKSCFRLNGYIVMQCLTKRNEYNNSDWIFIYNHNKIVWSTVARHYDSCEDSFADIVGVVSDVNQSFLMIAGIMNSITFVKMEDGFQEQYVVNSQYDPNLDYGM